MDRKPYLVDDLVHLILAGQAVDAGIERLGDGASGVRQPLLVVGRVLRIEQGLLSLVDEATGLLQHVAGSLREPLLELGVAGVRAGDGGADGVGEVAQRLQVVKIYIYIYTLVMVKKNPI